MHWSLLHIQYTILNFANEYIKLYLNNFLWRVSVSLMFVSRDPSVNFTTYFSLSAQQRSQCKFYYVFLVCQQSGDPSVNFTTCFSGHRSKHGFSTQYKIKKNNKTFIITIINVRSYIIELHRVGIKLKLPWTFIFVKEENRDMIYGIGEIYHATCHQRRLIANYYQPSFL